MCVFVCVCVGVCVREREREREREKEREIYKRERKIGREREREREIPNDETERYIHARIFYVDEFFVNFLSPVGFCYFHSFFFVTLLS